MLITVHQVNWLQAKASFNRATEEVTLVRYEMHWTIRFFEHHMKSWTIRQEDSCSPGHIMYAAKQVGMWARMVSATRKAFNGLY
jgi:hypothetical protein